MSVMYKDMKAGRNGAAMSGSMDIKAAGGEVVAQPVHEYTAREIKDIRRACGLTQLQFAAFMGVSNKTIEAWESGRNTPVGPACRLLAFAEKDPRYPYSSGLLSVHGAACGHTGKKNG